MTKGDSFHNKSSIKSFPASVLAADNHCYFLGPRLKLFDTDGNTVLKGISVVREKIVLVMTKGDSIHKSSIKSFPSSVIGC